MLPTKVLRIKGGDNDLLTVPSILTSFFPRLNSVTLLLLVCSFCVRVQGR